MSYIIIIILLLFIFIRIRFTNTNTNTNIEQFQNKNVFSFSDELVNNITSKNSKDESKAKDNYNYVHKRINKNDVIRFTNLNIKVMSEYDKRKKKKYYYRKFEHFINNFYISQKKKNIMIKLHYDFINDLDKKNQFFTDSTPINFYDLINNRVKKLTIQESLESLYLLFCILNQDLLSQKEMYNQFEESLGTHTYFMKKSDYLLSLTGSVLVKYPLQSNFVFKTKQMKEIYENIRKSNGVISIFDIYNIRTHVINYDAKLRNYVKNRVDKISQDALKNDKRLAKYEQNINKVKKSKKEQNYIGNIENNTSNTANGTDEYEEVHFDSDDNDVDKDDRDWTLPPVIKRPIKWRSQRPWIETEGPNFIDKNYKVTV